MTGQTTLFIAGLLLLASVSASAKTASTYYTPEKVQNARENIEKYAWAREIRDKAVRRADVYAKQPDDFLWELVTPQSIGRGIHVNKEKGCPKCGCEIDKFGNYPWKCDVINRPWKIECPSCGEIFPKNDFAKFYQSGKDEDGIFRAEKADRSLLFNTEHPDPRDPLHTYGVDDGLGWKDDKGNVYRFIGYYGHYGSWAAVISALSSLQSAYVYTGNPLYAGKAAIMLYRVAQFYPEMDYSYWSKQGFENSDGGSGVGKVYGRIWETGTAKTFISAYDAVYPALDDPQMLEFLSKKTGKKIDGASVRALIEKNIIRETHDAILNRQIGGNEGMHQSTMAMAAVVLDEPGTSDEWLRWIFLDGDVVRGDPKGGNIARLFATRIDEDGMGNEAAPTYNGIWRGHFRRISEILECYPRYKGPRITDFPKYRKMFETPVRLICLDKFIPNIGDCGKTGAPHVGGITVGEMVYAYKTFRDPLFAQMAYYLNGNKAEGIHGEIFDSDPEGIALEIEAEVKKHGPYVPKTENLPSYGLAILRSGKAEHQRALSLYYGSNTGHGHRDTLNIELFGLGLDLMPDHGYPEYATVWAPRAEWTSNTISHNTVVVNRRKQGKQRIGKAQFVAEGNGVSAAEVDAGPVYPETTLYRRTVAMVDVSDSRFYVVDIFRVRGGGEYHYSLHGPEGEVRTENLNLILQKTGTLAGEDIPYGADLGGREDNWEKASGFQYLYDVRRDAKSGPLPSVEWKVVDTWKLLKEPEDIRLRMTLVSPPGQVILAHGDPPQNKPGNPRRLTYLIATGKNEAAFVTVIEPYTDGKRVIDKIERADEMGNVSLKITLASGRTDYIVSALDTIEKRIADKFDFKGRFGVFSEENGKTEGRLVK